MSVTLESLLASKAAELEACEKRAARSLQERELILNLAQQDGRTYLTPEEDARVEQLRAQFDAEKVAEKGLREQLAEARRVKVETEENLRLSREVTSSAVRRPSGDGPTRHPLAYTHSALDSIQAAIDTKTSGRFGGASQERAALATGTYGAGRVWGSNVLAGPRLLSQVAGVPTQVADAGIYAQLPVLTLPSAGSSVGENVSLAEYATSTAGSVTLARFGRYTDLSQESMVGADAGALVAQHQIGVAKDLDKALVTLVDTAAGGAVAFTADVPAAIRKAMAGVIDATAAADVSEIVVLVHPDNAALLQSVTPTGGQTIAEAFQNFSGALVYASSAVATGFMLVANLRAGARYFEAQGVTTETDVAVKTGTMSIATSTISGYGLGLAGGAFAKVDVVTP